MLAINKKAAETQQQPTAKQQEEQVYSFNYRHPGVLSLTQNMEDYSRGVEEVLHTKYYLLPGASDILASWYNGSDFVVVIRGLGPTSVVYLNDKAIYRHFMREYGTCASIWHLVAPFPKDTPVDQSNYRTVNLRRGF